ncbi:MAG: (5-formylfuran-3-yl)methyl phosphate synthase [Planctomycetota bacterium]|nr:(5-formylfuran-3-yl)methyl phosphate synthase [Planctomycetota bacterium]
MVSIQDQDELQRLRATDVTWVDMKDPSSGALQPTAPSVWETAALENQYRLSVALGELVNFEAIDPSAVPGEISFVKIGLSAVEKLDHWESRWITWCQTFSQKFHPVIVAYADHGYCGAPHPEVLLEHANSAPFGAFLIDTFDKSRGSVFQHYPRYQIKTWLDMARSKGLVTVLGGSLRQENLNDALACQPDVIAVRGAATRGGRDSEICVDKITALLERLSKHLEPASQEKS